MALPVLQGSVTGTTASTTSQSVPLPTGIAAGELLLLELTSTGNATLSVPAGWNLINTNSSGATTSHTKLSTYWKIAGASEPAVAVTVSPAAELGYTLSRISGNHATSPIAVSSTNSGTGATATFTGVTTPEGSTLLFAPCSLLIGSASGMAAPTGFTLIIDQGISACAQNVSYKAQAAAGATGNFTATITGHGATEPWVTQLISVRGVSTAASLPCDSGAFNVTGVANTLTPSVVAPPSPTQTVNFALSTASIANPARGFHNRMLTTENVATQYTERANFAQNIEDKLTVLRLVFDLAGYQQRSLLNVIAGQTAPLTQLQNHFDQIRARGWKCAFRIWYTQSTAGDDAPLMWALQHMQEMQATLVANADLIIAIEAGVVGAWGEWAYSANYGTTSSGANLGLTTQQWADRKAVIDGLVTLAKALPYFRTVGIRTPIQHWNMYGSTPLADANRFDNSTLARLGGFNDGFVANASDFSTYQNRTTETNFWAQQTKYTCFSFESEYQAGYGTGAVAEANCAQLHATHGHNRYNTSTLALWGQVAGGNNDTGSYVTIRNKLGYRLYLTSATLPTTLTTNGTANIKFTIVNEGYAAPVIKFRPLLVMRNTVSGAVYKTPIPVDVRDWIPGTYNVDVNVAVPNLPFGAYDLLLQFADEHVPNEAVVAYSVQLANTNLWEVATGFNKLNASATTATPNVTLVASAGAFAATGNAATLTAVSPTAGSYTMQASYGAFGANGWSAPLTYSNAAGATFTSLTSGNSNGAVTAYTTASVTPSANKLLLLAVENAWQGSAQVPQAATISGNGLTWVNVDVTGVGFSSGSSYLGQLSLYRAMGTPSAGTITITLPFTGASAAWSLTEIGGVDTSGTNGSGAVVQSVKASNNSAGTTISATLAAYAAASNAGYATFGAGDGGGVQRTFTPESGWTEIHDTGIAFSNVTADYRTGTPDTTISTTASASTSLAAIGVELKVNVTLASYTLTANSQSYGITGNAAGLARSTIATTATVGTVTSTFNDAGLSLMRKQVADAASFAVTTPNVLLKSVRQAATGTFALTGLAAALNHAYYMPAAGTSFSINGIGASLPPALIDWVSVSNYGTANDKVASTSITVFSPALLQLTVGDVIVLAIGADNTQGADGQTSLVTSVVGNNSGAFQKAYEYTNGEGGAGLGATCSVWFKRLNSDIAPGLDEIDVFFAAPITAKVVTGYVFHTSRAIVNLVAAQGRADDIDPGSMTIGGLPSAQYLYFRAVATERNSFGFVPTAGYTVLGTDTTNDPGDPVDGTDDTNVSIGAEFKIGNPSTGDASDPTTGVPQSASVFLAFQAQNQYPFTLDTATYAVTAQQATLTRSYVMPAVAGTFSETGNAAVLFKGQQMAAAAATYSIAANASNLLRARVLSATATGFSVLGNALGTSAQYVMPAETGSFTQNGLLIIMGHGGTLVADAASFALAGRDLLFSAQHILTTVATAFASIAPDIQFLLQRNLRLDIEQAKFFAFTPDAILRYSLEGPATSTPNVFEQGYRYVPESVPKGATVDEALSWVLQELQRASNVINNLADGKTITLHAAPEKLIDGMIRKADGTDWNPGAGAGTYVYDGATAGWIKLG